MPRNIESPSGQQRVRTNLTIDPVYKAAWNDHGPISLSQLLEEAIAFRLSGAVELPSVPKPKALKPAERQAKYHARKSRQK